MIHCPICGKTNCIVECTPSIQQAPVTDINLDPEEGFYFCDIDTAQVTSSVIPDEEIYFACTACGTRWDDLDELAKEIQCKAKQ